MPLLRQQELVMQQVYLFQFDIIVKDSQAAPDSQWVFTTLVYDKDAPGDTNWDKMVPLGVMWGNDPDVMSPQGCDYLTPGACPPLQQTWINQATPVYARETLGWGGRLSGPNDGSVQAPPPVPTQDSEGNVTNYEGRYAMSSCMSCHGAAEYPQASFLLPVQSTCTGDACSPKVNSDGLVFWQTGNPEWMQWFQSRPGSQPQNPGHIALDYDMNYSFKVLPAWYAATQGGQSGFAHKSAYYRGAGH